MCFLRSLRYLEKVVGEASLKKVDGCPIVSKKFDGDTAGLEKVETCSEKLVGKASLEKVVGYLIVSEKFDGDTVGLEKVETCSKKVIGKAGLEKVVGCLVVSKKFDCDTIGLEKIIGEACVSDNRNGNNVQLCTDKIPILTVLGFFFVPKDRYREPENKGTDIHFDSLQSKSY
ncbi:hypothetical protein Q3G72_004640 [Acer saccharum]|nr:hypothetical protein Q3G72_004640 [Acer saccharum]